MLSKNQALFLLIILILAGISIAAFIYFRNPNSKTPFSPSSDKKIDSTTQLLLDYPEGITSEQDHESLTNRIKTLAEKSSVLDITNCKPNLPVLDTTGIDEITIKNNGTTQLTLLGLGKENLKIASSSSVSLKLDPATYLYTCNGGQTINNPKAGIIFKEAAVAVKKSLTQQVREASVDTNIVTINNCKLYPEAISANAAEKITFKNIGKEEVRIFFIEEVQPLKAKPNSNVSGDNFNLIRPGGSITLSPKLTTELSWYNCMGTKDTTLYSVGKIVRNTPSSPH